MWGFDLAKETDDALLGRLEKVPNEYYRSTIVRLLAERRDPSTRLKLERRVLDKTLSLKVRLPALWAILGSDALDEAFLAKLLSQPEPELRAWGVRAAGNRGRVSTAVRERIVAAGARSLCGRATAGGDCGAKSRWLWTQCQS